MHENARAHTDLSDRKRFMASLSSREYCSECVSTVSALANKQYQRKETTVRGREREREREREKGGAGGAGKK